MSEEIQNATPAVQESAEQVHEVESNSSEATTEQTQEAKQETQEQTEQAKKEPWFQKRINEQTRKYYEEARKRQELEQRLAQYEQRQTYQAPESDEQHQTQQPPVDVNSLAEQLAAQKLAERSFNEQCNKVYETGTKELEGFDAAVSNLQLVGVNREFLEAATDSDAGHKILHHLGQLDNLAEAERILNLPPVQMGRELAKLEIKLSQPVTKPVSKAPAPITPIGTGGATDSGLRDDLSTEEWLARRNKQLRG